MPRHPDRQITVSVDWLAAHLHDANLRIMDARMVSPTDTHPRGDAVYAAGHIPGAIFVHWRQDLSVNAPPVPNLLLDAEPFAAKMGAFGVHADTTVIVCDPGDENWAARLWWALKYYGHDKVYVLEGGAAAWQEAGQPWTTAVVQPQPTTFVARPRPAMRASKARVRQAVDDPNTTIIETRRQQNIAEAGGTVQGAFWLPSTTVFAAKGAYRELIPEAELDHYLAEIGADRAASLVAT
ncbi:MAG: sulfurtransferase [Candidatus Tectomicrobia bacterium]|uniref:Sulfurtransferase n=1 Tax=Tectimicrobiota bacterium TaxID=2528274 RepID=A0A938B502_UNCTE|nr:sulfurtransferase [Candidatus Tectomicrobia bacterium]